MKIKIEKKLKKGRKRERIYKADHYEKKGAKYILKLSCFLDVNQ